VLADGAPKDEDERFLWKELGYEQLPDGRWYRPMPIRGLSPEIIRKQPHGHVCKACRDLFRSKKYHDGWCPSCRAITDRTQRGIEAILGARERASRPPEMALQDVLRALRCPMRECGWQGNEGRIQRAQYVSIRGYLRDWVVASHLHWMRHVFWNRFPFSSRFVSKDAWKQHKAERDLHESLAEHFRKHPPIIEIPLGGS
jgi:hypothetical protein